MKHSFLLSTGVVGIGSFESIISVADKQYQKNLNDYKAPTMRSNIKKGRRYE